MKGRLRLDKWSVTSQVPGSYVGERVVNGRLQTVYISAHCLACAKTDILAEYGGAVDTRGWHLQGICGSFLKAMVTTVNQEYSEEF